MILVDTSIWIDLLKGKLGRQVYEDHVLRFVTCGPILQEIVQGLREHPSAKALGESLLNIPRLDDPLPCKTFLHAADIYSLGRRKGYSIRSSTDCLIAAIAIENDVPVWHKDRDFTLIARFTALRAYQRPAISNV